MDWSALVLRAGDPVRAFGRVVRNADGDWLEGPVSADQATQAFQDRAANAPPPLTRRAAEEVRNHLREHRASWNIYGMGIISDHVEARLTTVLPDMAAWTETLPAGILALQPWLTPAAQRAGAQEPVPMSGHHILAGPA
jgi:hypothetical protein